MKMTTIAVARKTKEKLRVYGEKGESYDMIIQKLIKDAAWKKLDARWNKILREDKFIPLDKL